MSYTIVFSKMDSDLFLDFWKKFEKEIDNFKNVFIKNTEESLILDFNVQPKAKKDILSTLKVWLADSMVVYYKYKYLEAHIKLPKSKLVPFKAVCKALAIFDKITDVEYVLNNLIMTDEIIVKSYYVFKLGELRVRWQEICDLFYTNLPELVASDAFLDLLKYLISIIEPTIKNLYITELGNNIYLKDEEGTELTYPIQKEDDYAVKLILEVIQLAPKKIHIKPEFTLKEVASGLKQLFNDKVVFSTWQIFPVGSIVIGTIKRKNQLIEMLKIRFFCLGEPMKITLKDNVIAEVSKGTTVASVAECISESLAKNAVCGKINGRLVDLNSSLGKNCKLEIITIKDRDAINVLWHSSSHILAQAVKSVYPNTKLGVGGYDETGFYYDFDFKSPITESDFNMIEDEMQKIIKANFNVVRATITKEQALMLAEENGEPYKMEIINNIPSSEEIGLYTQGDFSDFCDGPHLKSTGLVKAFKLTKITKNFFGNDERNKSLTRIYGVSFFYKKDLEQYLKNQEVIAKRNHLVIGEKLGLLGIDDMTNDIILLPKGQRVIRVMKDFAEDLGEQFNYEEVSSVSNKGQDNDELVVQSYRVSMKNGFNFPLKYYVSEEHIANANTINNGLFSCKKNHRHKFVSFARHKDFDGLFKELIDMVNKFYSAFGFTVSVKLYVGEEDLSGNFTKIKASLKKTLDKKFGDGYSVESGYFKLDVIKVEYILRDLLNRDWVVGNSYIDLSFSQKNSIVYTEEGKLFYPVTIVNNLCKSYERLFAILIESYAGVMPYWLAPVCLNINYGVDKAVQRVKKIANNLSKYKLYVTESFSKASEVKFDQLVPVAIFIGKKEIEEKTVKVIQASGEKNIQVPIKKFMQEMVVNKLNRSLVAPNFIKS